MSKRQKLDGTSYHKLKATRGSGEKCAVSLPVFQQKKYVAKAKYEDEDTECTSELVGDEHGENANMVESNIGIKVEEEFLAGINVLKELESDNDDVSIERAPMQVVRTGNNMKKELMK